MGPRAASSEQVVKHTMFTYNEVNGPTFAIISQTARLMTHVYRDFFVPIIVYFQPCQFALSILIHPI